MKRTGNPVRVAAPLKGLVTVGLTVLLAACATAVITPEVEQQIGNEMSRQVEQQEGLYHDPDLSAYVDAVGKRLVAAGDPGPYTFTFDIVDQAEPNAFASPGGYIYVSRGLLAQVNSEDELAGILAHEISHVTRRHHARSVGRQVGAGLLTLPGHAVGVINQDLGDMINAPIEKAGKLVLASYSRDQELDADAHGMQLAAAAGYDPTELAGALEGIERTVEALTGEKHEATFFDTHPTTPTRVADIERQAAAIPLQSRPPLADRDGLYRRLDGLWWGAQNPQQGVFQGQTFLSADLGIHITFPEGWRTVNTPSFVGAAEPEGGAYMVLGAGERVANPAELSAALQEKIQGEAGLAPAERRELSLGGWPASLVRYDDLSQAETVSLYYVFITSPRETFTLMAMAQQRFREVLQQAAQGFGPISESQAATIGGLRVRVAEQGPAETLEDFNERVGNQWPTELTAAMNGIDEVEQGTGGRKLKVVRAERYRP